MDGKGGQMALTASSLADDRQDVSLKSSVSSTIIRNLKQLLGLHHGKDIAEASERSDAGTVARINNATESLRNVGLKGASTLTKLLLHTVLKEDFDDREYIMERSIETAISDSDGIIGRLVTQTFIRTLWNDLQHPPSGTLSGTYRFRSATGVNTSLINPNMGAAGQSYARTVKPQRQVPAELPDPGLLFDSLMARRKPKEHPNKISSVLFYLATIIIHDIFRTNHADFTKSDTSSYIDLAPLYGSSEEDIARVRTRGGKGALLKPDCFSETRVLMLPPGSAILLVMLNRFHNHVAEKLLAINENNRFRSGDGDSQETKDKFEEETFQTARLITCGLYANLILIDYVRTILNLNRTDSDWQLNPRMEIEGSPVEGVGNQVSAEFNLVYRWHSTVSVKDENWTKDTFSTLFDGRDVTTIPMSELLAKLMRKEIDLLKQAPETRTFGDFVREAVGDREGFFKDGELVEDITSSTDDCANAYGPRQVPTVLRAIEVLGIQQARKWQMATLNEFRRHFSLQPHEKWSDITTDEETANHLKHLYKDVNNVELYPGLVVEDAKKPGAAAGLCPGFTTSRAVLSDAVALVRGDRFYTSSYHPRVLTNWGYSIAGADTSIDNGCVFYKLFQIAFPDHLHDDSIYSHFPLTVAAEIRDNILPKGLAAKQHLYDTSAIRMATKTEYIVRSYDAAATILKDPAFKLDLTLAVNLLCPRKEIGAKHLIDYCQRGFNVTNPQPRELALLVASDLEKIIHDQIKNESHKFPGFQEVDMVRDVIRKSSVRISARIFGIPFGEEDNGIGECDLDILFTTVATIGTNFDRTRLTALRQQCSSIVKRLRNHMLAALGSEKKSRDRGTSSTRSSVVEQYRYDILTSMFETLDMEGVFAAIIILVSSFATTISAQFAEVLDTVLEDDFKYPKEIVSLARRPTGDFEHDLDVYIQELVRLSSETVTRRVAVESTTLRVDGHDYSIKAGETILLSTRAINKDPTAYPVPTEVKLTRNKASYLPLNLTVGANNALWQDLHLTCIRSMLKVICSLPDLKRAMIYDGTSKPAKLKKIPVPETEKQRGHDIVPLSVANSKNTGEGDRQSPATDEMSDRDKRHEDPTEREKVPQDKQPAQMVYLDEDWSNLAPFPTSLKVTWALD